MYIHGWRSLLFTATNINVLILPQRVLILLLLYFDLPHYNSRSTTANIQATAKHTIHFSTFTTVSGFFFLQPQSHVNEQYANRKWGGNSIQTVDGDIGTFSTAWTGSQWALTLENTTSTGTQVTKVDINMELSHYRPNSTSGKSFFFFSQPTVFLWPVSQQPWDPAGIIKQL